MAVDRLTRRRRRLAIAGLSVIVGLVAAVINSGVVGVFPPKLKPHGLQVAAATNYVDVDPPASAPSLVHGRGLPPSDIATYVKRAELLGRMMVSPPVLERISQRCGISPERVSGLGRTTANVPVDLTQPGSEERASNIEASLTPYQVQVEARPTVPIIDVYAEAPTVGASECLANAAPVALTGYLQTLARSEQSTTPLVHLQSLGGARGGVVNGGATLEIAVLTFLTFFCISFATLSVAARLIARRRAALAGESAAPLMFGGASAVEEEPAHEPDSWPHTRRVLPWMLAAFMALIWLTPFNDIQLNASLPVELRLDRLVLPFVVIVWIAAMLAGRRVAPRFRMTWIHVAIGALLAVAFLSVVTDARYLNQTLELQLSLKKLPLILAYSTFFLVVASAVRRSEVRSFMSYTLGLAMIVAIGMIFEYRSHQNLFWDWSQKLLPGFFSVSATQAGTAVDAVGRPVVHGPTEVPLEAVAMLTMALPIAIVRIIQSGRWRQRIMYGVAVCLLVAATFATYRKSAVVAPVAAILTLIYFRRREMLKLAPLGLVLLVLVSAISPGALGSTIRQFTRSDATQVSTVSDRTSDYDAIRPDVWSHLALGRGWGSYDHNTYRILDSEILTRLIESGVVGLIVFLLVPITAVAVARRPIRSRDPTDAPVALIGASVAVGFVVLATLFDELSFPHAPYVFVWIVGLEAVILRNRWRPDIRAQAPRSPELWLADAELIPPHPAEAPLVPGR